MITKNWKIKLTHNNHILDEHKITLLRAVDTEDLGCGDGWLSLIDNILNDDNKPYTENHVLDRKVCELYLKIFDLEFDIEYDIEPVEQEV